jgi:hypothetical protein
MSKLCREVTERVEELREEMRNACRDVARTVSRNICTWFPWPLDAICDVVTIVITEIVCTIVYVVITIVSWVSRMVCELTQTFVVIINKVVGYVEMVVNRILTLPDWILCLSGVRPIRKKYRICPIVIADDAGAPVKKIAEIERAIEQAKQVFDKCGIDVIASNIMVVNGKSHLAHASGCNASGFFSSDRSEYEMLSCCDGILDLGCHRFPSGLVWPRHVLKAIWVTDIEDGKRGCHLPSESFVLIAAKNSTERTLAHEMGHAGDLFHSPDPYNLMFEYANNLELEPWQCCSVRASRFVTTF